DTVIHWYQQKEGEAPERLLFFSGGKASVESGFLANRYMVEKVSGQKRCVLTIKDVIPDDTATYYCAYWDPHHDRNLKIIKAKTPIPQHLNHRTSFTVSGYYNKVFGSGTKLIVSDKGQSQPSNFEILQKKHKNQIMYVCLIEKFYPEVIRVTWTEGENQKVTENIVKGEAWRPTEKDKYSISSWLTVSEENKDKKYFCNYEHESGKGSLTHEGICYVLFCLMFVTDHLYHRTAYLVYIVLLLKSSMYYLVVLFFIYR
ncbi:TCC4 protein, partial [Cepphus grylle]|nr:TCC4 protein [Cepphus grylle]